MEKKLRALRIDLSDDLAHDLDDIKNYLGIQADSDMIRFLIREKKKAIILEDAYNRLRKPEK